MSTEPARPDERPGFCDPGPGDRLPDREGVRPRSLPRVLPGEDGGGGQDPPHGSSDPRPGAPELHRLSDRRDRTTRRKVFFMAKDDLWHSRLLGAFLETLSGCFPVNRDGADRLALDRRSAVLERGELLIVFPEGTRRTGPADRGPARGGRLLVSADRGPDDSRSGSGGPPRRCPRARSCPRPGEGEADHRRPDPCTATLGLWDGWRVARCTR